MWAFFRKTQTIAITFCPKPPPQKKKKLVSIQCWCSHDQIKSVKTRKFPHQTVSWHKPIFRRVFMFSKYNPSSLVILSCWDFFEVASLEDSPCPPHPSQLSSHHPCHRQSPTLCTKTVITQKNLKKKNQPFCKVYRCTWQVHSVHKRSMSTLEQQSHHQSVLLQIRTSSMINDKFFFFQRFVFYDQRFNPETWLFVSLMCTHRDKDHSQQWGLCALRHGSQNSMAAILACHPAQSTEWLDCVAKLCELWHITWQCAR